MLSKLHLIARNKNGKVTKELIGDEIIGKGTFGQVWSTNKNVIIGSADSEPHENFEISEEEFPDSPVVIKILYGLTRNNFTATLLRADKEIKFFGRAHEDLARNTKLYVNASFNIALIMPMISKKNLHDICNNSSLSLSEFLNISVMLVDTLTSIHNKNIIHLDIKTRNIMGVENNRIIASIRIVDFGMAEENNTSISTMKKDPEFSYRPYSRDRIHLTDSDKKRINANPRHDFYSAGVTLQSLLKHTCLEDAERKNIYNELHNFVEHYNQPENTNNYQLNSMNNFFKKKIEELAKKNAALIGDDDMVFEMDL